MSSFKARSSGTFSSKGFKATTKINVKAFWNGSVLADLNFTKDQYEQTEIQLEEDDLYDDVNYKEAIEYLDSIESELCEEYMKKGSYYLEYEDMFINMLLINSLVNKGLKPNDDKYGLVILKEK